MSLTKLINHIKTLNYWCLFGIHEWRQKYYRIKINGSFKRGHSIRKCRLCERTEIQIENQWHEIPKETFNG